MATPKEQELHPLKEEENDHGSSSGESGGSDYSDQESGSGASQGNNSPDMPAQKKRRKKKHRKYGREKKLPSDFAEKVLELEMQIERDCSNIDNINKLLYLYSVCLFSFSDHHLVSCRILQWDKQWEVPIVC